MGADQRQAGFTLLEVIVALVIATLALVGLFSGAATGLRSSQVSADYQSALSRARSHLAALGDGSALVPGTQTGDDGGGFRWQVRVAPLASVPFAGQQTASGRAPQMVLLGVAVAISWSMDGGERQVALETQRIGFMAPAGP
jgi:general secretion pathway protein I